MANGVIPAGLAQETWKYIPVEVWDYNTLIQTIPAEQGAAQVFFLNPKLFFIRVFFGSGIDISNVDAMLQLKFPGYVKDNRFSVIVGGSVYLGVQSLSAVQGTGVGLYVRPNVTKSLGNNTGTFSAILMCMDN